MFRSLFTALILTLFAASPSLAHAPKTGSVPEDKAVLSESPASIDVSFASPMRLTKVTLASNGTEEKLEIAPKSFATTFSLPVQALANGDYTVEWRGMSEDGHVMDGSFTFTIKAP
jgi:methionine-rich copper-binding protein CopC